MFPRLADDGSYCDPLCCPPQERAQFMSNPLLDSPNLVAGWFQDEFDIFGAQSVTLSDDVLEAFKFHFKAGFGGYPLVGTSEQIVAGIDRVLLFMEQAGRRKAFPGQTILGRT